MPKATTVRFTDEMFARLDQTSARTGMPVNSIVIAACLEWMQRHTPTPGEPRIDVETRPYLQRLAVPPRWATLRRAVELAVGKRSAPGTYPFERFTASAQKLLTLAQAEALKASHSFIGTEHMVLAAFEDAGFQSAKILAALQVDEGAARAEIDRLAGKHKGVTRKHIIPTSRVKLVIETAFRLCAAAGDPRVSTGHVLLALAAEGEGIGSQVLNSLGATKERIESEMDQLTEKEA
jgi:hypothetical protein